ncbi:MAG: type IV secretory system conjugative DNA transfer family protein [Desulfarculales bacterium]|jgi:type IV secretion system protein VirD4|nr:type IV secretory system conjugative DNA transfer family protein [Desulfarculales bacterium]
MAKQISGQYGLGENEKVRSLRWLYGVFMIVLGLLGMSAATQTVAAHFKYIPALGQDLFKYDGLSIYWPWKILEWRDRSSDPVIDRAITLGQAIFLGPQFILLGLWLGRMGLSKGSKNLHGSAHWATWQDIKEMSLLDGSGVYVGGWLKFKRGGERFLAFFKEQSASTQLYLRHGGPEHLLCFAPTRSGKGVGLILPTLLSWPHSSLVFDIKGENWALTSGWRKSQGQVVLKFDPSDSSHRSACFNPFDEIRLNTSSAIPDTQNLVSMLLDPEGKGLEDYWHKAAFAFLGGALLHCLISVRHKENRSANLTDLSYLLADKSRPIKDVFTEMLQADHNAMLDKIYPEGHSGQNVLHEFISSAARDMLNKADSELSGVVSTAGANLALYRDPVVSANISRSDFHIHDLMNHEQPVNLYLVVSPADINRLRPLIRIIVTLLINRVSARMEFANGSSVAAYRHRLLLMLDELTALGKLSVLEKGIAFVAGYGVKCYLIVQDIVQLNGVYGKDNALMANCHIRIAYAPNTIETARVLSDMTGKTTVVEQKTSLSGARVGRLKNASVSVSETARPLLTADECMRLPGPQKDSSGKVRAGGDMLIFMAGRPPVYGRQILYFLDPIFSARARIEAPRKSDSLYCPAPNKAEQQPVAGDKTDNDKAQAAPPKRLSYADFFSRD